MRVKRPIEVVVLNCCVDRAVEKLEIIRLVEQSPLPVRHTLVRLGIPRATFYRWYDRYSRGGPKP